MGERHDPPSCTFVAAVVDGTHVVAGWLGDSRVYWLPDAGDPIQLSSDDSGANELMALGMSRAKAESSPQAHAITRWLGADAHDVVPRTAPTRAQGPGWVLVCSDGLWNYCSEATAIADLVRRSQGVAGPAPEKIAAELVRWANEQGGADNITAALHRIEVVPGTATVDTVHS
jgi:serine/threonine protein phosphatase PrpC